MMPTTTPPNPDQVREILTRVADGLRTLIELAEAAEGDAAAADREYAECAAQAITRARDSVRGDGDTLAAIVAAAEALAEADAAAVLCAVLRRMSPAMATHWATHPAWAALVAAVGVADATADAAPAPQDGAARARIAREFTEYLAARHYCRPRGAGGDPVARLLTCARRLRRANELQHIATSLQDKGL